MTTVTEIAPDVYRISTYMPKINLQFNQFLVVDEEPLLFHTGFRRLFPAVREAVARIIPPESVRWIGFSHFEADECGSLGEWQAAAPQAVAVCSRVGKLVSVDDFAPARPARGMVDDEVLITGKHRFRFIQTPHVPHCWEAGMLFEETQGTLFCSDLFLQQGDVEARTAADVVGRFRDGLIRDQQGPFADAYPYTPQTRRIVDRLAALRPKTLAIMHGSAFTGDGAGALRDLGVVMEEILGGAGDGASVSPPADSGR
ncbi:MAG: MBL fold metallo-hydrolase [Pseudomonadota bacterium]|nr:MBL fold metallo-hydrolase [Pseudomonadota bacterium]